MEKFKETFLAVIDWGWSGEYANHLRGVANDGKRLVKLRNAVKLTAYRNRISEYDALICLIRNAKV